MVFKFSDGDGGRSGAYKDETVGRDEEGLANKACRDFPLVYLYNFTLYVSKAVLSENINLKYSGTQTEDL